jgi:hypothetical protein
MTLLNITLALAVAVFSAMPFVIIFGAMQTDNEKKEIEKKEKENKKMNSLVITVDGTSYTFECHSYTRALEILAGQYSVHPEIDKFELL